MKISLIWAMANDRAIGKDNQLLWHLPDDLQRFKTITMGHPIIMGRKTFESIGRVLPGRQNIILTSQKEFHVDGADICSSPEDALSICADASDVFVIGGQAVYQYFLPKADRLYMTIVDGVYEADAYFPDFDLSVFAEIEREEIVGPPSHVHTIYDRK